MSDNESPKVEPYRVLARKYRPQSFAELIGQDALVQTLKNAIEMGRIAHAFMLTGVRGVGKTTTARIIAKALNYTGADGHAGPTTGDTSDCALCQAITEDRHPDVIEMDAASRTGIDDIREILDGVRYAPSEARYKIYIIDEVHMLSKQAFNALLKTLEEPPEHVKFIFATTEIRKVPITVLSRCQRFDLRRVDVPTLAQHFSNICDSEAVRIEDDALQAIARAADGSVRDGLSILDQAMALSGEAISFDDIQKMLGLSDRGHTVDILDHVFSGDIQSALQVSKSLYDGGADPLVTTQDMLELVHIITRIKSTSDKESLAGQFAPNILDRLAEMSSKLSMPSLGKAWQLLMKALQDVQYAPNPQSAFDMVLIRLIYAADLPDPKDLIKTIKDGGGVQQSVGAQQTNGSAQIQQTVQSQPVQARQSQEAVALAVVPPPMLQDNVQIEGLEDIVKQLEANDEVVLASYVFNNVELIKLKGYVLEIGVRDDMAAQIRPLQKVLSRITQENWVVSFEASRGLQTLAEKSAAAKHQLFENVLALPQAQDILQIFPGAKLVDVIEKDKKD